MEGYYQELLSNETSNSDNKKTSDISLESDANEEAMQNFNSPEKWKGQIEKVFLMKCF